MRACAVEMHANMSQEPLYTGNLQVKCRSGAYFVRACPAETHFNISQEPLHTEIDRKNAGAQSEHPDLAPRSVDILFGELTVRTPQCGHAA